MSKTGADPQRPAWQRLNDGTWTNSAQTYVHYLYGTTIPEPSTYALLAIFAVVSLVITQLRRKQHRA